MKVEGEDSKEFAVRVGIHQGSIVSPLIFVGDGCGERGGGKGGTWPDVCR